MRQGRGVVNSSLRQTNFQACFLTLSHECGAAANQRTHYFHYHCPVSLVVSILSGPWLSMHLLSMTVWGAQLWGVDGHPCPSGAVNKQETV